MRMVTTTVAICKHRSTEIQTEHATETTREENEWDCSQNDNSGDRSHRYLLG